MGIPGLALYGATKAALDRFADAYAFENEDAGLLSLVYPVSTRTSFFERAVEPGRLPMPVPFPSSSAEEVASAVVRGVERGRRHIFPSRLFWGARFFQAAFEVLVWPYQWFYAQKLRKWVKSRT
jgi:short-subunit dehydrogenase